MNERFNWLIGARNLHFGDAGVEFGFEHPIPAWAWALVVMTAIALSVMAYRRLEGRLWARALLAGLRAALLIVLALLISGPRLIKPNETEEKDWVLALVDRSASLSLPDAPVDGASKVSRDAQLRSALLNAQPALATLAKDRVVVWVGFDSGAYELPADASHPGLPTLAEPTGLRTDIDRAIEFALRRAAARPLSGIVLFSDGRSIADPNRALLRRLESERVPVFSVPLGSAAQLADVGIRHVEAPRSAFVNDLVPFNIELERSPAAKAGETPTPDGTTIVELVDQSTGAVLDSREINWSTEAKDSPAPVSDALNGEMRPQLKRVTLTSRSSTAGASSWRVRVRPAAGSAGTDAISENDTSDVSIELVDRPLRVAYFDGYPRWEYRYLTSLLVREASISSAIMLLAPGKRYIQEGSITLDALPTTAEQWKNFDVIIIGDIVPSLLTSDQLEQIKQRVSVGGAGLIWIAGEAAVPSLWRSTTLGDLLPMSSTEAASGSVETFTGPTFMRATAAAERLGVLRLNQTQVNNSYWPAILSDPSQGWPLLYWMQRIDPRSLKPAAEVLATASTREDPASAFPAVVSMRFGAGRSVYIASDEIWRWRYGRGELYPERFWLQLVRLLGRESLSRSGRTAIIEASPERVETNRPVRVAVTLLDQALIDAAPASVQVRVRSESHSENALELTLVPEGGGSPRSGATRTYSGTWVSPDSGKYRIEPTDPLIGGSSLAAVVNVFLPDDELRQPQTNHPLLEGLSKTSGGKVVFPDQITQIAKLLPNRRVRQAGEPDVQSLWDSPLALAIVILLATLEWVGRRLVRLA